MEKTILGQLAWPFIMTALTVGQKRLCSGAGWFAVAPRGKDATTSFCVECRNRQHLLNQYQVKNDTSAIQLMTSYTLYMPSLIKKNHQTHLCMNSKHSRHLTKCLLVTIIWELMTKCVLSIIRYYAEDCVLCYKMCFWENLINLLVYQQNKDVKVLDVIGNI